MYHLRLVFYWFLLCSWNWSKLIQTSLLQLFVLWYIMQLQCTRTKRTLVIKTKGKYSNTTRHLILFTRWPIHRHWDSYLRIKISFDSVLTWHKMCVSRYLLISVGSCLSMSRNAYCHSICNQVILLISFNANLRDYKITSSTYQYQCSRETSSSADSVSVWPITGSC